MYAYIHMYMCVCTPVGKYTLGLYVQKICIYVYKCIVWKPTQKVTFRDHRFRQLADEIKDLGARGLLTKCRNSGAQQASCSQGTLYSAHEAPM